MSNEQELLKFLLPELVVHYKKVIHNTKKNRILY